jgi:NADH:ubiquinone oxidoreductase subunit 6 (subunit J)
VPPATEPRPFQRWLGTVAAGATALAGTLLFLAWRAALPAAGPSGDAAALGRLLVGPFLFAFELIAVLLLAALVGAYVLVKRKH